jgi:hypothetical protein
MATLTRIFGALTALALGIASFAAEPLREFAATAAYVGFTATALAGLVELARRRRRVAAAAQLRPDRPERRA